MALSSDHLSPAECSTLQDLVSLFGSGVLLVGGTALRAHFGMPWRVTDDVDVYVAISGPAAAALLNASGWKQSNDPKLLHRWISPAGCKVDVVPAGQPPGSVAKTTFILGGPEMNVVGTGAAFKDRQSLVLDSKLSIDVAGPIGLFVLKASAYLDAPDVRPHDLADIAWLLERHEEATDRRFETPVVEAGVPYEDTGAFLLGMDVARLVESDEHALILRWLGFVEDARSQRLSIMGCQARIPGWRDDPAESARQKLLAFRRGFCLNEGPDE